MAGSSSSDYFTNGGYTVLAPRTDGSGYPDGLRAHDIPILARVLQVVDVYDALCTARPYKAALSHAEAEATMVAEARSGKWDHELVHEFFSMLERERRAA